MIYADFNATYPCQDSHLDMVSKTLKKVQGNPSSMHQSGRVARLALEESRTHIAELLGCDRKQIIFTSGATEANNLAIHANFREGSSTRQELIITGGEHPSVRQPAIRLEKDGYCQLHTISLTRAGTVDVHALLEQISPRTKMICIIYGNNETGIINPVRTLIPEIRERSATAHIHVDGVQAFGKVDTQWLGGVSGPDSFAASAHKIGGFKGIGFLFLRQPARIQPMLSGGGQESGLRSGTENIPGIISLGLRAKDILSRPDWLAPAKAVRDHLLQGLLKLPSVNIHGDYKDDAINLGNTVNFHLDGVAGESLMAHFDLANICVSGGSACSSGLASPSPVLLSMGFHESIAASSVRVSFGDSSTKKDADAILTVIRSLL
ncbi:MAG: cysteine desulfurase [Deltaproteobacteria bacterium]|nr:cysteine desulfurase [Deltaproteobacteria bacterium]